MTWEYMITTFGPPPPGKPGDTAHMTYRLNTLGAQGWEAFAYNVYSGTFFLKRQPELATAEALREPLPHGD